MCLPLNLLVIPELVLGPGIVSSSDSLSWPQGTEFVDSYLKLRSFFGLSIFLSYDSLGFYQFIEDVPLDTLRQLTEPDHRKALVADRMYFELLDSDYCLVWGVRGIAKRLPHTVFECIRAKTFDDMIPAEFFSVRFKYDYMTASNELIHTLLGGQ